MLPMITLENISRIDVGTTGVRVYEQNPGIPTIFITPEDADVKISKLQTSRHAGEPEKICTVSPSGKIEHDSMSLDEAVALLSVSTLILNAAIHFLDHGRTGEGEPPVTDLSGEGKITRRFPGSTYNKLRTINQQIAQALS